MYALLYLLVVSVAVVDADWLENVFGSMDDTLNQAGEFIAEKYKEAEREIENQNVRARIDNELSKVEKELQSIQEEGPAAYLQRQGKNVNENIDFEQLQPLIKKLEEFQAQVQSAAEEDLPQLAEEWQTKAKEIFNEGFEEVKRICNEDPECKENLDEYYASAAPSCLVTKLLSVTVLLVVLVTMW